MSKNWPIVCTNAANDNYYYYDNYSKASPLDCVEIGNVVRHMGVLDYSFVDENDVRFVVNTAEQDPPGIFSDRIVSDSINSGQGVITDF